jgi:O-antigen/teichoic acid export membrane protein
MALAAEGHTPGAGARLRGLAGETLVYGGSTMFVRLLNYALVPLHTVAFAGRQADYGVISELYAWVTFLNVIFLYGMETAFFRYAGQRASGEGERPATVFGTALGSLALTTALGATALWLGAEGIARALALPEGGARYVRWFTAIIALDTLAAIPFAALRLAGRPWAYAGVKLANVLLNVGLNAFFLAPLLLDRETVAGFAFDPAIGVGYVFLANLAASGLTLAALLPGVLRAGLGFDRALWRRMLRYGLPFVFAGLAGMVNETLDRILLVRWLPGGPEENRAVVGVYSAAYKLSIFMTLAVQAFRMGAEPFFFRQAGRPDAQALYALVMRAFVPAAGAMLLVVSTTLSWFGLILGGTYRSALLVVPVLLLAGACLGIYYNLSVWFKLTDRTRSAAWLAAAGALVTLAVNAWGIPRYGYWASAGATLAAYALMATLSALWGRRHYPVPYPWRPLLATLAWAAALTALYLVLEQNLGAGFTPGSGFETGPPAAGASGFTGPSGESPLLWPLRLGAWAAFGAAWWAWDGRALWRALRG